MALANSEVMALLASPKSVTKPQRVLVRTKPGTLEWQDATGQHKGGFEGRAGTPTRSRKGNISRKLNGRREYVDLGNWWDETSPQVVAY